MQDSNGGVYLTGASTLSGFLITGCTFRNMSFAADNTTDAIQINASAASKGGIIAANDFVVDQGSGNGTGPSWNRPRYLVNLTSGFVTNVTIGPYAISTTRGDASYSGTAQINDLATNTVIAWAVGVSGSPELKHSGGIRVLFRNGAPEGAATASTGSLCINTAGGAGTTLYVKESGSGNTGWIGK